MTDIVVKRKVRNGFRCSVCDQVDVYDSPFARPVHCERPMQNLGMQIVSGDPDAMEIALLKIDHERRPSGYFATDKDWPDWWTEAHELWRFSEGRNNGERIGWLGTKETILVGIDERWEFIMVPGCTPREGVGQTRLDAIAQMWGIINAG